MVRLVLGLVVNIIGFVVLRYINIFLLFLKGIGPDSKYSIYDFVPALLLQIVIVLLFAYKDKRRKTLKGLNSVMYVLILISVFTLFIASHLRWIPHSLIPY